jgi:hypothetical protein
MAPSPLFKKYVIAALLASLGGCSTLTPMEHDKKSPTTAEKAMAKAKTYSGWDSSPVMNDGSSAVVLHIPASLPKRIYDEHIQFKLNSDATLKDVIAILGQKGIPVVLPDAKAGDKTFYIPYYNGKLGDLLSAISQATDTWFIWGNGVITVSEYARIAIDIPQEKSFGEALKRGLTAMGVGYGSLSWEAGMATADVTPSDYRKVKAFLTQLTNNAVVVNLQVAVINVTLNQDANQGVNWGALSAAATAGGTPPDVTSAQNLMFPQGAGGAGATAVLPSVIGGTSGTQGATSTTGASPTTTPSGTPSTGTTTTTSAASASTSIAQAVGGLIASGGSVQGALFSNRFSFSGLFDYLETYGNANTSQNVILRTIAGNTAKFKSVTQVPYVSQVGVTTNSGSAGSSSLGSTSTSTANDGIEVALAPTYDASAGTVTVDFKLSLQAVLGFNNLSAGNQIGSLTQPTTADQTLLNTLRMRPGQTVVVGGLTYNSVSDSKNAPIALVGSNLEHQSLTVKRQTMFVVIRPTIVKFGVVEEKLSDGEDSSIAGPVLKGGAKLSSSDLGASSTKSNGSASTFGTPQSYSQPTTTTGATTTTTSTPTTSTSGNASGFNF